MLEPASHTADPKAGRDPPPSPAPDLPSPRAPPLDLAPDPVLAPDPTPARDPGAGVAPDPPAAALNPDLGLVLGPTLQRRRRRGGGPSHAAQLHLPPLALVLLLPP